MRPARKKGGGREGERLRKREALCHHSTPPAVDGDGLLMILWQRARLSWTPCNSGREGGGGDGREEGENQTEKLIVGLM